MEIKSFENGNKLCLELVGRLDTNTAPQLEAYVNLIDKYEELTLDMKQLEYTSSAGLRVLLTMHKQMSKHGSLVLCNVSEDIMEVFNITGFSEILNIK